MAETQTDSLIFGLDGVLWNTSELRAQAWTEAIRLMGGQREVTIREIESISGHILSDALKTLIPSVGEQHFFQVLSMINQCEKKIIESTPGVFYEGVLEGLLTLSQKKKIFLVSNSHQWYVEAFFKHSRTQELFRSWNSYGRSSMAKDAMLRTLTTENQLQSPLFIGDTVLDLVSAQRAEMNFGFVTYGFGSVKAKPRFESFTEIVSVYK